jgi:hypothetical protein
MTTFLKSISYVGLAITVLAPLLFWNGKITIDGTKTLLIVGMILWFATSIFWIKHEPKA